MAGEVYVSDVLNDIVRKITAAILLLRHVVPR